MTSTAKSHRIFAVGGAHIDRRGRMSAEFVPGASIPGSMREDIGGVFNAARAAVRRGTAATLMSVRGGDASGQRVAEAIAAARIDDASVIFLDRATPSYTALLDREGHVVAALADMALYDLVFPKQMRRAKVREELALADAVLTDANLPESALKRLVETAGKLPIFAIAISPAKAVRLVSVLPRLSCLFMNRPEATALAAAGTLDETAPGHAESDAEKLAGQLRALGLRRGVITDGGDATIAFDAERGWRFDPPAPRRNADAAAAGDALAGATVAALLNGSPFPEAVREGMAATMLAIDETEAAAPLLPADEFATALTLVPAPVELT
jgi:pseudouridine kinase